MSTEETPEQRRAKISSLSSEPIAYFREDEEGPSHGEEAGAEVLRRLTAAETIEKLEQAGRYSRARWKMQVWIKSDRSVHKPLAFTLSFWESGKRLHGGGDESAFICRRSPNAPRPKAPPFLALGGKSPFRKAPNPDGCDGIIASEIASGGFVVCPHCGMKWDTEHIGDSLFYRVPVEVASTILVDWFHRLDSDCDLYVKFRDDDIRTKMMALEYGTHIAKQLKGLVIYPLSNIVADLSGGATLESRFKALLLA